MNHICPNHVNCGNEVAENRGEKKKKRNSGNGVAKIGKKRREKKLICGNEVAKNGGEKKGNCSNGVAENWRKKKL